MVAIYGASAKDEKLKLPIGDLTKQGLGRRVEYADRVLLGLIDLIDLIVRDDDEKDRIVAVGPSIEPTSPLPVFLSGYEISVHLDALRKA